MSSKDKSPITAKELINKIPELPELEDLWQTVLSGKPRSPETLTARKYLLEQLIAKGYKRKEIAKRLDLSRKTIYNILHSNTWINKLPILCMA